MTKKVMVFQVSGEAVVIGGRISPGVPARNHVGQNHSESPDIVVAGRIRFAFDFFADALCGKK